MFFRNISADYGRITSLLDGRPWIVRKLLPFTTGGFQTLIIFRLIQANRRWRIPLLYWIFAIILKIINTLFQAFWGICIASGSDIGPGLYIAHHGMIFIGVKKMGANCTIGHNVTIGRTEKDHGYPVIGDNVYIAPGALVIGKIEIGDNVKIGPLAVVRRGVPSNSVVMAPPPRVIRLTSKDEWERKKDSVENEPAAKAQSDSKPKQADRQPDGRRDHGRSRPPRGTTHHRRGKSSYDDKRPARDKDKSGQGGGERRDRRDRQASQTSGSSSNNTTKNKPPKVDNKSDASARKRNDHHNRRRPHRNAPSGQSNRPDHRRKNDAGKNNENDRSKDKAAEERKTAPEEMKPKPARDPAAKQDDLHWSTNKQTKWVEDMEGESLDD